MNDLNYSQKLAARPHASRFLACRGVASARSRALLMLVLAGGATASAQVVTNSADSGPGTLRSAITNAASGAVITFAPGLSGATITLSNTLTLNTNLTIDASALPGGLQINGNGAVTVFNVATNIAVLLNSLTITNAYSTNTGGGIYNGYGGGIYNVGTLTLTNCTLSRNFALFGGGIYNVGTLTLNQCTLSGNGGPYSHGGGIYNHAGTVTLNQCTLFGNSAGIGGGGIFNDGLGTLTLNQCTPSGNSAGFGGGIYNIGTLSLTNCTLSGNSSTIAAPYGGGGIFNYGTLSLTNCILSGNSATNSGGGINNYGLLTMNQCTLSGNSATYGGGIYNGVGTATLNQCTLSGNSAIYDGGGILNEFNGGTLALNQCTLSGNSGRGIRNDWLLTLNQCTLSGNSGGGILNYYVVSTLAMTNTIVGGNNGTDIYSYSGLTYGGSNLVQSVYIYSGGAAGPAPLTNAPDLAPLGNYGGPTQTMPPLPGSPAIGAGSVAANTFSTDQRGFPRTQNGLIDIGAVELQSPAANPPVLENLTVPAGGGNGLQFTFTSAPAADFTVLTATNVSLALTHWTVLGEVQQVAPGQYQFTDPQAATNRVRFDPLPA